MKKSITTNYLFNLLYQILSLISPLVLIPYLTKHLGSDSLGIFSYTLSIVTIFHSFASLGVNVYGQREIAYLQDNKEKRSILFWELFIIRIISTFITIITLLLFVMVTSRYKILYLFFLPYFISNFFDITWLYQGMEDFKSVSVRNLIVKVLYIISIILFVKTEADLYKYIFLYSIQFLVTACFFWVGINTYIKSVKVKKINIKKHFKNIFLFFLPQVASTLYTMIDKTMIGLIIPEISEVYFYEQATYIVKTIMVIITTLGSVMISNVSYLFSKKEYDKIKYNLLEIINFVWLIGCPLVFGICAVISNIVPWFYGAEYLDIIDLTYYLAPLILIIGLNNIVGFQLLIPMKRQNKYVKAVIIGTVCNLILNVILINFIGSKGAAISSVCAEIIILLCELQSCKDIITFNDLFKGNLKYIIYGIFMFFSCVSIKCVISNSIISFIVQCLIGVIVYFGILLIMKDKFLNEHVFYYFKSIFKIKYVKKRY